LPRSWSDGRPPLSEAVISTSSRAHALAPTVARRRAGTEVRQTLVDLHFPTVWGVALSTSDGSISGARRRIVSSGRCVTRGSLMDAFSGRVAVVTGAASGM